MSDGHTDPRAGTKRTSKSREAVYWLVGASAFVAVAIWLEDSLAVSFGFSLRIVSIAFCQWFLWRLRADYPGARWPRTVFWLALMLNAAVLFSPLTDRPPSRGEIMVFALPDAILVLALRAATYKVADVHQRAVRQQLILALVLALAFYGVILTLILQGPTASHWGLHWHSSRMF